MSQRDDPVLHFCAAAQQLVGLIHASENDSFLVETSTGSMAAQQAFGCFLVPQVGDTVLIAGSVDLGFYITQVLHALQKEQRHVVLPAGSLECVDQKLHLKAESMHFVSNELLLNTQDAKLYAKNVIAVGQQANWYFSSIKTVAEMIELITDRWVQFSRWSQRTVSGAEQLRCQQMDYKAEHVMSLQSQNIIAHGSQLAKIDGAQIHIG